MHVSEESVPSRAYLSKMKHGCWRCCRDGLNCDNPGHDVAQQTLTDTGPWGSAPFGPVYMLSRSEPKYSIAFVLSLGDTHSRIAPLSGLSTFFGATIGHNG